MKVVVTGASGHVGSYVVPILVQAGYDVIAISSGRHTPYTAFMKEWTQVQLVEVNRKALESERKFGHFIMSLKPDVICDLNCYNEEQAKQIVEPSIGYVQYFISIGSIWIYGYNITVPVSEGHPHNATDEYGLGKIAIEKYLLRISREGKLPCTVLHPGHVVGKGWVPLNPQGNFNKTVYEDIAAGREVTLPFPGTVTIHHVHAEDVARLILVCLKNTDISKSETYHITSSKALTLRGFAESLYNKYGHTPAIKYLPLEKLIEQLDPYDASQTLEHVTRSPAVSMDKAKQQLNFIPKYTSFKAVEDSLDWFTQNKK